MKTFNRAILGADRMASAFLLGGFILCNFGAQANVPYSKIGWWSVAYLEVGNLSGCRATAQSPGSDHLSNGPDPKRSRQRLGDFYF
jgi:hypothetical protein